MVLLKSKK